MSRRNVFLLSLLCLLPVGCFAKPVSDTRGTRFDNIVVEIWVNSDNPQPGETLKIRATVSNRGSIPFQVELKDRPVLDIRVGPIRWSQGKPLTYDLTRLDLKPGEAKTRVMDYTVDQNADGGALVIQAIFIDSPKFADDPITASVVVPIGGLA